MAVRLGRLIAVLFIAVLAGALYLGIQEQKIRTEKQASEIAKESFGFRCSKKDEAGFGGEAAAEKITRRGGASAANGNHIVKARCSLCSVHLDVFRQQRVKTAPANDDEDDEGEDGQEGIDVS